jgi:hypothetical protein
VEVAAAAPVCFTTPEGPALELKSELGLLPLANQVLAMCKIDRSTTASNYQAQ